eukprot:3926086-Amphidinium_carterae.1
MVEDVQRCPVEGPKASYGKTQTHPALSATEYISHLVTLLRVPVRISTLSIVDDGADQAITCCLENRMIISGCSVFAPVRCTKASQRRICPIE